MRANGRKRWGQKLNLHEPEKEGGKENNNDDDNDEKKKKKEPPICYRPLGGSDGSGVEVTAEDLASWPYSQS